MPKPDQLSPVSSRAQNLGFAVSNPKRVLPASARAQKMADALEKDALKKDSEAKSNKQKGSSLAAMIKRAK